MTSRIRIIQASSASQQEQELTSTSTKLPTEVTGNKLIGSNFTKYNVVTVTIVIADWKTTMVLASQQQQSQRHRLSCSIDPSSWTSRRNEMFIFVKIVVSTVVDIQQCLFSFVFGCFFRPTTQKGNKRYDCCDLPEVTAEKPTHFIYCWMYAQYQ